MNLNDLRQSTGEWLRGVGPLSDVVISSRIRLARNLDGKAFLSTADSTERREIYRRVSEEIADCAADAGLLVVDLENADSVDRELLVERHVISRQHMAADGARGVILSPAETQAVMINEEDHLRMQGLRSGLQLEACWTDINRLDDSLAQRLPFAFDQELGFLTACPTNVGTGIRVSVMLHLPALKFTKEIERVARAAKDMRLAVRGLFGEGTEAVGDFYQVSNQTTLGRSEATIIQAFSETIVPKIVEYERQARASLAKHRAPQTDDKIWRAYGVLCNARCISSAEVQTLLSPLRMGIHMGRFNRLDIHAVNELLLFTQPAHLQRIVGRALDAEERGLARAAHIRQRLGMN